MLILRLLRPTDVPKSKANWGFRLKVYCWLLNRLKSMYLRGAVCDTIKLDNIVVIHTVRDYWYENELSRLGVKVKPTLVTKQTPFYIKNKKYRLSNCFNWKDSFIIIKEEKKYHIQRDSGISVKSDIAGVFKTTNNSDLLQFTEFMVKNNIDVVREGRHLTTKKAKQKIHINDKVETDLPPNNTTKPTVTKKAGFDVNDIF